MLRQFELVERVRSYEDSVDEEALNRAYVFAMMAHGSQKRASGDPYFSHPVEVAGILADMKLDDQTIITGLLHDTVEDTPTTLDDIAEQFGKQIAQLVDGVTKLSRIEIQSEDSREAENFRKLFLAMSDDLRVLLVKLADRLHNMRTLRFIKDQGKRMRIAQETMGIYAPLAERIGMQSLKDELEDLAFGEFNPNARDSILERLKFLNEEGGSIIPGVIGSLETVLAGAGINAEISGREKQPYSIWRKMQLKSLGFEQLSDIVAFRVIVGSEDACYSALGAIHRAWPMVPGRFKDYISTPKPNDYRSLHTTIHGPDHHRLEIQIRTRDMDEIALYGLAAHWSYRDGKTRASLKEGRQYRWIRQLLDILEHAHDPVEFLEHTKLEMFQDQVFCFTPQGKLIALPRNATPVDFAYAVHTEVGDTCVGAKINGKIRPLKTVLLNGDQVEILGSSKSTPDPGWEGFVVTGKARSRIRRFVRSQERDQYRILGRSILVRVFSSSGHEMSTKYVRRACRIFSKRTLGDLYIAIGRGEITGKKVVSSLFNDDEPAPRKVRKKQGTAGRVAAVPIGDLISGVAVHYAACCHPLPGERIVGIMTPGTGMDIHTIDCERLPEFESSSDLWYDAKWLEDGEAPLSHVGQIDVVVLNAPGALGTVTTLIGQYNGNILNLNVNNRSVDFFAIRIDVEVRDVRHLVSIIADLRTDPNVTEVHRVRQDTEPPLRVGAT